MAIAEAPHSSETSRTSFDFREILRELYEDERLVVCGQGKVEKDLVTLLAVRSVSGLQNISADGGYRTANPTAYAQAVLRSNDSRGYYPTVVETCFRWDRAEQRIEQDVHDGIRMSTLIRFGGGSEIEHIVKKGVIRKRAERMTGHYDRNGRLEFVLIWKNAHQVAPPVLGTVHIGEDKVDVRFRPDKGRAFWDGYGDGVHISYGDLRVPCRQIVRNGGHPVVRFPLQRDYAKEMELVRLNQRCFLFK